MHRQSQNERVITSVCDRAYYDGAFALSFFSGTHQADALSVRRVQSRLQQHVLPSLMECCDDCTFTILHICAVSGINRARRAAQIAPDRGATRRLSHRLPAITHHYALLRINVQGSLLAQARRMKFARSCGEKRIRLSRCAEITLSRVQSAAIDYNRQNCVRAKWRLIL